MGSNQLFDPTVGALAVETSQTVLLPDGLLVAVEVDVAAIREPLDYVIAPKWSEGRAIGDRVRVPLSSRTVDGWIVGFPDAASSPEPIREVVKLLGLGPSPTEVALCKWAARRWASAWSTFLAIGSPPRQVKSVTESRSRSNVTHGDASSTVGAALIEPVLHRLPPATAPDDLLEQLAAGGDLLVICPTALEAGRIRKMLVERGHAAVDPSKWELAAAGGHVVGTRSAVFSRMAAPSAIVVIDEHDELLGSQGSPTWNAREVAIERARRNCIPAVLVSPCPSLEALDAAKLTTVTRAAERRGWAALEVIDHEALDEPFSQLISKPLVAALRGEHSALCILNRKGRSGLVACDSCSSTYECERCAGTLALRHEGILSCSRCGYQRPIVCMQCGASSLRLLRPGTERVREELVALLHEPVDEVTVETAQRQRSTTRVQVGTNALLRRASHTDMVAFLDFDAEMISGGYRAAESSLGSLALASRLVGGRERGGRVLCQVHGHSVEEIGLLVLDAARQARPDLVSTAERELRTMLQLPPASSIAVVGGEGAPSFIDALELPDDVSITQAGQDQWLLRSAQSDSLLDALEATPRPAGRLRLQVDPARLPEVS